LTAHNITEIIALLLLLLLFITSVLMQRFADWLSIQSRNRLSLRLAISLMSLSKTKHSTVFWHQNASLLLYLSANAGRLW